MDLTLEEVKRAAKREDFRAGVQMRLLMPRLSVRVTRWVVTHTRLAPNQITLVSFLVGLGAAASFASVSPLVVVAGLLAYHLHVLLDYVDGEVARCRGRLALAAAMVRGLTAFLTYTAVAAVLDAAISFPLAGPGSCRALVLWAFAPLMPIGAVGRFLYVFRRGAIPRRQQLL